MTLALLSTVQHVSDVNTSIFRSLRLLGALLCRLYCAVMIEVHTLTRSQSNQIYIRFRILQRNKTRYDQHAIKYVTNILNDKLPHTT